VVSWREIEEVRRYDRDESRNFLSGSDGYSNLTGGLAYGVKSTILVLANASEERELLSIR